MAVHISEKRKKDFNSFTCPTCRHKIEFDFKIDSDKVAKTFPVSSFLEDIAQTVKHHESPELSCEIHSKRPTEFYCFTDHSLLCSHCLNEKHRNQKCDVVALNESFEKKKDQLEKMRQELIDHVKQLNEALLFTHKRKLHRESIEQTKSDLNNLKMTLGLFFQNALDEIDQMEKTLQNVPYVRNSYHDEDIKALKSEFEQTKTDLEKIEKGINFSVHFDNLKSQKEDLVSKFKLLKVKSETQSTVSFVPQWYIKTLVGNIKKPMQRHTIILIHHCSVWE